jgi:integrase
MAVYDRWHLSRVKPGAKPCQCSRGKNKLYPSAEHGIGDRWQVRWRDENDKQCKLNRPERGGKRDQTDPDVYAEALDAQITAELNAGTYIDPKAGEITFKAFAEQVIESRTLDPSTREKTGDRLKTYVYPMLGDKTLRLLSRRPSLVQNLVRSLEKRKLSPSHIKVIMANVSTVFAVAIDDGLIVKNPCRSSTVVIPKEVKREIVPWTPEYVDGMREKLPKRYAAMIDAGAGLGMRQGEILGFSPDDIDWLRGEVTVQRQVKVIGRQLVFALPKGDKVRKIPLPESVKLALSEHMRAFPAVVVTLPWETPEGTPVKVKLFFTNGNGKVIRRETFNNVWRRAREAAGIVPKRKPGEGRGDDREHGMHALRHFFASALITEGESIKAVSIWLGHSSIKITLDLYTHLMPKSEERMRKLIDAALAPREDVSALNVP